MYCIVGTTPCNLVRSQNKKMHRAARLKNLPHTYSVLHWSGHFKKCIVSWPKIYLRATVQNEATVLVLRAKQAAANFFFTFYAPIWPLPLCIAFQGYTKMVDTVKKYISAAQIYISCTSGYIYIDKKTACNFLSLVT